MKRRVSTEKELEKGPEREDFTPVVLRSKKVGQESFVLILVVGAEPRMYVDSSLKKLTHGYEDREGYGVQVKFLVSERDLNMF